MAVEENFGKIRKNDSKKEENGGDLYFGEKKINYLSFYFDF